MIGNMRIIIIVLIFTLSVACASGFSGSESGYNVELVTPMEFADSPPEDLYMMTFIVNPTTSGLMATEGGFTVNLNLYSNGVGGYYNENDYELYLVPEQAFISHLYDITANDPAPWNRPPIMATLPDQTMTATGTLTVLFSAFDPDGDAITITSPGLASFSKLTDNGHGTGIIIFNPGIYDTGEFNVQVKASDGLLNNTQFFTLTIDAKTYNWSESGYHLSLVIPKKFADSSLQENFRATFIVNPTTSGLMATEGGFTVNLNLYSSGVGGSYKEGGYQLFLVPEQAFISHSYDITINDPSDDRYNGYISLSSGWNMISLPVKNATLNIPSIVWQYSYWYNTTTSSYQLVLLNNLEPGKGYWVAAVSDTNITLSGKTLSSYSSNLSQGWNMIGGVDEEVDFSVPNTIPPNSVLPYVYWYYPQNATYLLTNKIEPKKGYWAAAVKDCRIELK